MKLNLKDTHCDPNCGLGCTHAHYLKVLRLAQNLRRRAGKGWSVNLWDNLGWQYNIVKDNMRIRPFPNGRLAIEIAGDHIAYGNSPRECFRNAACIVDARYKESKKILRQLIAEL